MVRTDEQEWYRKSDVALKKITYLTQTFIRFLDNGSQAVNLLHGGSIRSYPNHKQKFGRRQNLIYASSSMPNSSSASSAEKHVDERGEYRMYLASPIFKTKVYLDAWGKAREGLGLVLRKS